MKVIEIILVASAIVIVARLVLALTACLKRIWKGGVAQSRDFARAQVTFDNFTHARVPRQDSGSLIPTRAGLSVRSTRSGVRIAETRTVAKDIF